MLKGAIARRYAEAAFELGVEHQTLDRWLNDLRTIADYLGARQLTFILSEPNIQFDRKEQVVRDLLQDKVQKDALGLALLIVQRQHIEGVKMVRDEFERLYDNHRGQAHAMLSSTHIKPPQLDEFFLAGEENLRRDELRALGLPLR